MHNPTHTAVNASLQQLMYASNSVPSPRETKRHNWLTSCFGIFEDDPVTSRPDVERQRHGNNWGTCCGIFEEYDPVIYHPEMHLASPASPLVTEQSQVSGPIWRKNIIMGGKCKLPDFSGVIIYDSAGTLVSGSKPSRLALPWK